MSEVKTVKFGGTSLANAEQFEKVRQIILSDESRRYVVPSAPGKRSRDDEKITDMLYGCYEASASGKTQKFEEIFGGITERFDGIIAGLGLKLSLAEEYKNIRQAILNKAGRDFAASRGEYLSGIILAKYINYEFIDAAEVIFFDERGFFDAERTQAVLSERLAGAERAVIPGFYGSMPNDTIKTFSRGGSDVTGSVVARGSGADVYENWTDVSGFMMADPKIVENPKNIQFITYQEMRELAYMGVPVLHEEAVFPVRRAGIPINIRNTNAPGDPGTMIMSEVPSCSGFTITGIAGKKHFAVITIEKNMMNNEVGFGRRVLEVLEEFNISFEHLPSGIDTLSVVLAEKDLRGREAQLEEALEKAVSPDSVHFEYDMSLIAIVGRGMINTSGTSGKVFSSLGKAGVNVRMIDQGSSQLNIIVGIDDADFEKAVRAIYGAFILT